MNALRAADENGGPAGNWASLWLDIAGHEKKTKNNHQVVTEREIGEW